jgi:hypothetical protein
MSSLEDRQDLQDCSGLSSIHKILNNPVNPVYSHFMTTTMRRRLFDMKVDEIIAVFCPSPQLTVDFHA